MKRFRRIVHPSDFSPASGPAFRLAVDVAKSMRAEMILVHVLTPVAPVGEGYISPTAYAELERSVRSTGQRGLDRLLRRARQGGVRARAMLLEGAPYQGIVRAAKSRRADLIVMGTHGRGGLAKLLLGSVAERVIAAASCPVMTVRSR
jgi:nucleotide-binding universal stress UspA family protein